MANVTIRDLPVGTDPADVDEFVYNDDGVDRRITKEALEDSLDVSNSTATTSTGSQTVAGALDDRVVRVGSVAEMEVLEPEEGITIHLSQEGRAGTFKVKTGTPPSDPQQGFYIILANGNYAEREIQSRPLLEFFGIESGVDASGIIQSVFNFLEGKYPAVETNVLNLNLGGSAFDGKGLEVYGNGAVLDGFIKNTAQLQGFTYQGKSSIVRREDPTFSIGYDPKTIVKTSANEVFVFSRKETKGYALYIMKNNVTTATQSLASGSSDITSFRVTNISDCVDAYVGAKTANASLGTWSDVDNGVGISESYDSGDPYTYKQNGAGSSGDYYEVSILVPKDGYFNVAFARSSGSCPDVSLSVDGVDIDANFTLVAATAVQEIREYKATPGTRLIRVTRNTATGSINYLGVNYSEMKSARNDLTVDSYGYYRNDANYDAYLTSSSANDYAILEVNSDLFGGSFHGGETGITTKFLLDGDDVTLSTGVARVCSTLKIEQEFAIDWTPSGGPSIDGRTCHTWVQGGYAFESSFDGEITIETAFLTLYGVTPTYNNVVHPETHDMSLITNGNRALFGRSNSLKMFNDSTEQYLSIRHSTLSNEDNSRNGAYVLRESSLYNKYYYGYVDRGLRTYEKMSAVSIFKFG